MARATGPAGLRLVKVDADTAIDEVADLDGFRLEARGWLEANAEPRRGDATFRLFAERHDDAYVARAKQWQARVYDAGWAGISWPRDYGGRGASVMHQLVWDQEAAPFEVPEDVFAAGIRQGGPTILSHGTDEQKRRYLPPLLRGDEIWCQLFSEPGAGSDLASVSTRAEPVEGGWLLTGQKLWTSGAHYADVGFALARTRPHAPKHHGITYLLVDMHAPGVTVRPLRQMTGGANFNEVFLDEVWVADRDVVGEVDGGWRIARTTLLFERALSGGRAGSGLDPVRSLLDLARQRRAEGNPEANDAHLRQELAQLFCWAETLRLLSQRAIARATRGEVPGPESSVGKLAAARVLTRSAELAMRILGPEAMLDGPAAAAAGAWQHLFLAAPAVHIAGGTDEVQRNIIGEQALGLPRDDQPDRHLPFHGGVVETDSASGARGPLVS